MSLNRPPSIKFRVRTDMRCGECFSGVFLYCGEKVWIDGRWQTRNDYIECDNCMYMEKPRGTKGSPFDE